MNMKIREALIQYANSTQGELFEQTPEYVLDFVHTAFSGEIPKEELRDYQEFWYSIASSSSLRAFAGDNPLERMDWIHVANATYTYLTTLPKIDQQCIWSWMLFKVKVINRLERESAISIAKPEEIVNWFYEDLTISYDEMRELLSLAPSEIAVDKRREMMHIRERAKVISLLKENEYFRRSPELQKWIQLFGLDTNK